MKMHSQKKALLIVHQKRSDPGEIGNKLIKRGYSLDIKKPALGERLPKNMDNHDVAIIFGGPMSINDSNLEFIKYEIDWIDIALKSNKPFLGICLGAQMLAKNLGGNVNKCFDDSYEIGFFKIIPTKDGIKMFNKQKVFFQWHNEGFSIPNDCTILAKGEKFQQQAFKYNNSYGLQFHPEVNINLHLRWLYYSMLSSPEKLRVKGFQKLYKQLSLRIKYNTKIKDWLDMFFDNYLLNNN